MEKLIRIATTIVFACLFTLSFQNMKTEQEAKLKIVNQERELHLLPEELLETNNWYSTNTSLINVESENSKTMESLFPYKK